MCWVWLVRSLLHVFVRGMKNEKCVFVGLCCMCFWFSFISLLAGDERVYSGVVFECSMSLASLLLKLSPKRTAPCLALAGAEKWLSKTKRMITNILCCWWVAKTVY